MQMRMEIDPVSERLDDGHNAGLERFPLVGLTIEEKRLFYLTITVWIPKGRTGAKIERGTTLNVLAGLSAMSVT